MCKRVAEEDFIALENVFSRLEKISDDELLDSSLSFLLHLARASFERAPENGSAQVIHPCVERAARALRDVVPPPSVPQLARQVGLSPSRLSRLFKAQTGLSLTEFRSRQCHERALCLCETDLPLSEVAAQAGFGSYAQFHRVFCERSGCSPNQLRRNLK
jgi:AraC-like DNA-binding protein